MARRARPLSRRPGRSTGCVEVLWQQKTNLFGASTMVMFKGSTSPGGATQAEEKKFLLPKVKANGLLG